MLGMRLKNESRQMLLKVLKPNFIKQDIQFSLT